MIPKTAQRFALEHRLNLVRAETPDGWYYGVRDPNTSGLVAITASPRPTVAHAIATMKRAMRVMADLRSNA